MPHDNHAHQAPHAPLGHDGMLVLRARPTAAARAMKVVIPLVVVLGVVLLVYRIVFKEAKPEVMAPEEASTSHLFKPGSTAADAAAIQKENEVQTVARATGNIPAPKDIAESAPVLNPPPIKTIPPPPPDNSKTVVEEKKDDASGAIGESLALGLLAIQIENYWIDDDKKNAAYAILSGNIQNASKQQMTLPQIEVALLDNEKRLYKPSKQNLGAPGAMNPLMKAKAVWFFELPPAVPMYCAQFTLKQGKAVSIAYVRLAERTPENLELMDDKDYQNAFVELMLQASPRVKAQEAYYKAKSVLDGIGGQIDDIQLQAAKLEKKLKVANDAAENAKAGVDKAKKDTESTKAWMKEIDSSPAKFNHNQRLQEIEMGKAQTQAQRCQKAEQSAAETLKAKMDAKTKLDAEMKDLQTKLKSLATKYETQEKATDKLKEKIE